MCDEWDYFHLSATSLYKFNYKYYNPVRTLAYWVHLQPIGVNWTASSPVIEFLAVNRFSEKKKID